MEFLNLEKCSPASESCSQSLNSNSAREEDKDCITETLFSHAPNKFKQKLHPHSSHVLTGFCFDHSKKSSSPTGIIEQ